MKFLNIFNNDNNKETIENGNDYRDMVVDAENSDDVMMVTNKGRIIRSPVNDIRIASRNTQGVTLFSIDDGEKVVSVTTISLDEEVDAATSISENLEKDEE